MLPNSQRVKDSGEVSFLNSHRDETPGPKLKSRGLRTIFLLHFSFTNDSRNLLLNKT